MEDVEEFKSKKNEEKPKFVARTTYDIQRIKLEKLMKNPVSQYFLFRNNKNIFCFGLLILFINFVFIF